jgi:hypothetical protein
VATADPKQKLTESGHQGEGEGGLELSGGQWGALAAVSRFV